jgi:hypothetical protein
VSRDHDPEGRRELLAIAGQIVASAMVTASSLGTLSKDELQEMADKVADIAVLLAKTVIRKVDES